MIESMALRRRLFTMGSNARPQRTVTPVQRSNGVSPTPNPRGVEGRDLLLCPPVLGLGAEYLPPLVVFSLVEGYYWAPTRRPVVPRVVPVVCFNMIKSHAHAG